MKTLLTNAKIIDENNNKFKDVDILINEDVIEKIIEKSQKNAKNQKEIKEFDDVNKIDCKNNIVLYGFINPCSSLIKNFFESFSGDSSIAEFNEKFENFVNNLSMEEKYSIYKFQILNLIKNGITTFCDEDYFNLALKKAVKETGENVVYRLGIKNCFEEIDKNLIEKFLKEKQNFVLSLGSVLENTEENFDEIIKLAKHSGKPVFVCGSENLEVAGLVETEFSKTTTKLLEEFGLLDINHVIVNNNVLDKDDYEILNFYNSNLVFSPSFNLTFGYQNANIYALSQTNQIGLSSFKNNYALEMFLANNIEKENYNKFEIFSPKRLFDFSTKNNAQILGLDNQGEIKEKHKANLLICENENLFLDANSFLKNFENEHIKTVIISGKIVLNANHFVEDKSYEHLKKVCNDIVKKLLK
ncbi:MAG: amidohydrolase family protein [Christensenellales bacterium]